jgi:adenosine deaminase
MARDLGCPDPVLADLARGSILASRAPEPVRSTALRDIDAWLAAAPEKSALPV